MAAHVRRQLREAVAGAVTGLTTTGSRVFQTRHYPLADSDLPCLLVSTAREESEYAQLDGALERIEFVEVIGVAKEGADLDDKLDLIAQEVEVALTGAVTVSGIGVRLDYKGADYEFDAFTDKPVGALRLRFEARLWTSAPDTLLNA